MQAVSSVSSVSIIMKVWNALAHVRLCLKTLLHNTDGPFELIVIDNGSQPEVVEFLRGVADGDPRVRLILNPTNIGPSLANRQGVELARHGLICLIDSDVLVPHGWLGRLVAEFERRPDVKLLAPLNYHQTLSHPFGPENSAAAWFRTRKENERSSPLRQFHAYSGGLSIDEFDELMCSAHAGELAAHSVPARLHRDLLCAAGRGVRRGRGRHRRSPVRRVRQRGRRSVLADRRARRPGGAHRGGLRPPLPQLQPDRQ